MVNPSKAKGTAAETAIVKYAQGLGFPFAERIPLHGNHDHGDIRLAPGLILEVKAGKSAQTASLGQVCRWMSEAMTEARNAHADAYGLIVQRQGIGLSRVGWWEAWLPDVNLPAAHKPTITMPLIMVTLRDALLYWRADGYGDPL